VTLIGEPGIGKSRLVAELRQWVDARPEIVYWRQGRCLPYGEGVALWAVGEIVKAHAGILESDDPETARQKLAEAVEPLVPNASEQVWIMGELARLVGAGERGGERDESFAAWRAFLEAVAAQHPVVVVVEDLHWADAALLEFLEHLVEWSAGVPLLVLCTARPELHEVHPAWSGGKRNATTISLSPLSSEDTARLLAALLERTVLPAETQQTLLERAGGNPLYAEQFVRMLRERPAGGDTAVPETVQALIAARLDTLGSERKALLQDAAVIGKVFWSGAVAAVGGHDERAVRDGLHELVRRELVRPARLSSVEGETELAFGHGLVRDVAYSQIPRAARASKHEAAARWIEGIAGERVEDHAELLAHHYREALALARAAGVETQTLEDGARRFLWLAGERAFAIDAERSDAYFEEALRLTPPGHPDRGRLLTAWAEASERDSVPLLEEAIADLRAAGDEIGCGKAMLVLSHSHWFRGNSPASNALLDDAVDLLEQHEPGPELAHAYSLCAGRSAIGGVPEDGLEWAEKGIALAERLGLENFVQRSRQFRGIARCELGDYGGIDELRESLRVSVERGLTREANIGFNNYGSWVWLTKGASDALPVYREGIAFNERRGRRALWHRAEATWPLFDAGLWDEILEIAEVAEASAAEHGGSQPLLMALASKGRVLFYRGRTKEAEAIARELLPQARAIKDPQILLPTLALAVLAEPAPDQALALIEEMLEVDAPDNPLYADSARVCVRLGAPQLAERMIRTDERASPRARHVSATIRAILAEARDEREEATRLYADAVRRWTEYPFVLERGLCLLGLSRASGDPEPAEEARALFHSLGAEALESAAAA
jgi:tetratricopeptide (TPR) repeat protein